MSGQRPGSSDHDAEWWRDDVSHGAPYRDPYQEQPAAQQPQGYRPQSTPRQAVPGQQGGRAEARRAQQQSRAEVPPPAGPGGRAAARAAAKGKGGPVGPGGKKKRNRKKVVAWVAAGALGLVVVTGGALYLKINGNISTFDKDGLSSDRPDAAAPDANGNTPINVLLIGSDSRAGGNADLGGGEDGGARSDTTILLHVYADRKHAVGVSFPRDAMVARPKCKLPNGKWTKEETSVMFNSAFSVGETDAGNPACTQNTVEKLTGLRVDHTIVVNFQGFAAMTSAVGGVTVCLPNAIYEGNLNPKLGRKGKEIFPKGEQKVSGQKALDYVRLRHGIGDGSDIGRMKRQQAFLSALIKDVKSKGMDATTLLPLADAATKSLIVDEDLGSAAKLLSFALSMKNIDLHNIQFITTPWRFDGSRVALVKPDVDVLWQALKSGKTLDGQDANAAGPAPSSAPPAPASSAPAAPPASVKGTGIKVSVYNGTTTAGLTTGAVNALKESKFTVGTVGNASTQNHATTVVQYGPGQKTSAQTVAELFPGATLESSTKAGINLVLGKDYAATNGGTTTPATTPTAIPSSIAQAARPADTAACDDVSYGSAG
ncbi:LCP family protein required for cell wall assembly [Kitasatospora gansuensis]|uniref:LCP family protein required for cell wall assembly n=1 Tax=Kitasatospora gansuensis TaxID=258050 RepID=A0A7W7SDM8_9ACTN|nr:LCP family protein [Kitasatospora gansuensis]MBB4947978.1 LCP family protein required for cell wall assembly [Kitasatospora gansuensis]